MLFMISLYTRLGLTTIITTTTTAAATTTNSYTTEENKLPNNILWR